MKNCEHFIDICTKYEIMFDLQSKRATLIQLFKLSMQTDSQEGILILIVELTNFVVPRLKIAKQLKVYAPNIDSL